MTAALAGGLAIAAAHDRAPRPLAAVVRSHRTKPLPRFVRHETPTRIDNRTQEG